MGIKTLLILALFLASSHSFAEQTFPREASLKRSEVNVRAGPGVRYPILWIFERRGWPVLLLTKYDNWYKIRDIEGEEGWVYIGMVTGQKTAVISEGEHTTLYKNPDGSKPLYRLKAGVTVALKECGEFQCQVSAQGTTGWLNKTRLIQAK